MRPSSSFLNTLNASDETPGSVRYAVALLAVTLIGAVFGIAFLIGGVDRAAIMQLRRKRAAK